MIGRRILVTGSAGHLGEALIRAFQSDNIEAIGVDIVKTKYTRIVGDLTDRAVVKQSLAGITDVVHTATLHKPHIPTHSRREFINNNILGTLNLLEESVSVGIRSFIYNSTTGVYGDSLNWVTEKTVASPNHIYGITKLAAENLCQLISTTHKLPTVILRTSRFFPEEDESKLIRKSYTDENAKAIELLYRRVDIEDVVSAYYQAIVKSESIGFGKYIISASNRFHESDMLQLTANATSVVERYYPSFKHEFQRRNWKMFPKFDRVYVNYLARQELEWKPKYDFDYVLQQLAQDKDFRSPTTKTIGYKGYHKAN